MVSDFDRIKLFDLDERTDHEFHVSELYKNVKLFGFIAGYQKRTFKEEDPVNIKAAELMGKLHDQLEEFGYSGHALEVYLVRLLFILFADDTSIFEKDIFKDFIDIKTNPDGSDLGAWIAQLFQVLNTPKDKRLTNLDDHLNQFPYVNGKLFEEMLPIAAFNSTMRAIILEASALDWGKISPAIFGSLFQSVMNPVERRNLGAHYTSEKNIFKLIKPLFLDELRAEFNKVKGNSKQLKEFHHKLSTLRFLDPACGSGNFLIITYRELRLLEIDILRELFNKGESFLDISQILWIDVDQFYGIEYDDFASKIAEVAMWLIDHQMNMLVSEEFGQYFARLPLNKVATIVNGNALRIDWESVVPKSELSYIIGNPPFYGKQYQSKEQRNDIKHVFHDVKGAGVLDYVSAWYYLAAKFISNTSIKCGYVSTNSICQGEQVGILWNLLISELNVKIHFAHTTFKWNNEARGKAAVHCIIVGFAAFDIKQKKLFEYFEIGEEPSVKTVRNINPYLVEAKDTIVAKRTKPIDSDIPQVYKGNQPTEGGFLLLNEEEKTVFITKYPTAENFIKPVVSGREFLNGINRYCFWLVDVSPQEIKKIPELMERIHSVKQMRLESSFAPTRELANYPTLFRDVKNPETFIVIPATTSERRSYIPFGFFGLETIPLNSVYIIPNGTLFHFGVLMSSMHMSWVKYTCGRLKSDYRYSKDLVYNNYPWPKDPSEKNRKKVEEKAQAVLDTRELFPESSLADLYDPLTMPPKLVKAHQELDKAVDLCYRPQPFINESSRIEFLFDLYNQYTAPLLSDKN